MKITPEMFGLTKEEVAKFEKQDERIARLREDLAKRGQPGIAELLGLANRLSNLLENSEPGLFTWREAVARTCAEIGEWQTI